MLRRKLFNKALSNASKNNTSFDSRIDANGLYKTDVYIKIKSVGMGKSNDLITDSDWTEIESAMNKYLASFPNKLLSVAQMSELEFRVSLLIKLGLRPNEMALVLNKSKEAITSIRRRLSKKILSTPIPTPSQWDEYVKSL